MNAPYKVLIADDNESLCNVLKELLNEEGYEVSIALRGDDALLELQRHSHHVALIDLRMPGLHGMEVFEEIKENFPHTDVIIITSHASIESAVDAIRLGAHDYLIKPFDLDIVSHVVRRTITRRRLNEENGRLYEELKSKNIKLEATVHRLSSLNEMSRSLHSFKEIEELLNSFVQIVATELDAKRVSLMLVNEETDELMIKASVGLDENMIQSVRVRKGEGIAGWVLQEGKAILVDDIEQDPRFRKKNDAEKYDSNSFISAPLVLSIPLIFHQKTIGVININNKKTGGVFTTEDMEFVYNLANQAATAIVNVRILEELNETHFEAIIALAEALEAKDAVTRKHSDRMLKYALQIAKRLGLRETEKKRLRYLAVLHDIGKIGIPEQILQKPGKLTHAEYDLMKKHPILGAEIVKKIKFLSSVAPLILTHHEWFNGNGYPYGLAGEEIPIEARIVAVLDSFDAMTSDRPYRKSLGMEQAIQELSDFSGRQFDPVVVHEFLTILQRQEYRETNSGTKEELIPSVHVDVTGYQPKREKNEN